MIIFRYEVGPAFHDFSCDDSIFRIEIMDDKKENVATWFRGKKYLHTLSETDLKQVTAVTEKWPELLEIKELEPNDILDGDEYNFTFSDGVKSNSFCGFNIRDYSSGSHPKASMALRAARYIKEMVLDDNNIRTMIPRKLSKRPWHYGSGNIKI